MIAQHEQQHAETMLATHQLRQGDPVLDRSPTAGRGSRPVCRPRCWCRAARSPWARRPIRGRWTTSGRPIRCRCRRSGSTPSRSPTATTRSSSPAAATTIHAGGTRRAGSTGWKPTSRPRCSGSRTGENGCGAGSPDSNPCPPTSRSCMSAGTRPTPTPAGRANACPTESEWEKAARHDPATDTVRQYPWGDDEADRRAGQPRAGPSAARAGRRLPGRRLAAGCSPAHR